MKIGPSTFFKSDDVTTPPPSTPLARQAPSFIRKRLATIRVTSRSKSPKTRSLSPKAKSTTSVHWCPPPGKTSKTINSDNTTTSLSEVKQFLTIYDSLFIRRFSN